jgi:repressor LexA
VSKFSDRLHYLRKENKFSMEELCNILLEKYDYSTNKSMISKYEKEVHEPNFTFINHVADIFGVSVDYMMGRKDDKYGENAEFRKIPILGTIEFGIPLVAQKDIVGYDIILPDGDIDFCFRAKDDSMSNANINLGDTVFIQKRSKVENGEIVVVHVGEESATLKRYYNIDGNIILRSENSNSKELIFSKKDAKNIMILGVAIYTKFEVK